MSAPRPFQNGYGGRTLGDRQMPDVQPVAAMRHALAADARTALLAVGQLARTGEVYRRAAWGPGGEPNRANEALLALERAAEELRVALDCFGNPTGENANARPE